MGRVINYIEHPFGKGDLTSDGVQWSATVDTTTADTDVAHTDSPTIEPPDTGKIIELEFGLTAAFVGLFTGYSAWVASTAYVLGNFVVPSTHNGYIYECTTAGSSGTTEPVWPTVVGNTIADNTVVWTCRGIDIKWKWQACNKDGTWVDLLAYVTETSINNVYVERTMSGRKPPVTNFDSIPFEVQLVFQCNRLNQGRAKIKNSGYIGVIYSAS
ncbi:hypothetical protein KJ781_04975 [Patescibacteria group bacterium]|uniref:Putative head decoration protein n=1 Tax=viral metagenome TaxID=1070528 RepID=A0A6H1ZL15_9ZZZZ|nr:hypothetical protein [Patescibacteria group bacterium]